MTSTRPTSTTEKIRDGELERRMATGVVVEAVTPTGKRECTVVGSSILVGRDPRCDLVVDDSRVSGLHAEIIVHPSGKRFWLCDLGSSNGTLVDVAPEANEVGAAPVPLPLEVPFQVGRANLRLLRGTLGQLPILTTGEFGAYIGEGPYIQRMYAVLRRAARRGEPVLLCGEANTGRGRLGLGVHMHSSRASGPFVPFDSSAGAPGLEAALEKATGGTLYVGGWPPPALQSSLLNAHRDGQVRLVVACGPRPGCWANAGDQRATPEFLWLLLRGRVRVPALRERLYDIGSVIEQVAADELDTRRLTCGAIDALSAHDWPGNLGELRATLRRIGAGRTEQVTGRDVRRALTKPDDSEILRVAQTSASVAEAARILGCSRRTVRRVVEAQKEKT